MDFDSKLPGYPDEGIESSRQGSLSSEPSKAIKNENADDGLTKKETKADFDSGGIESEDDRATKSENTEGSNGSKKKDYISYLPLYKAAIDGDWIAAGRILENDREALTAEISEGETILHVAVSTGRSIDFVHKLVDKMTKEKVTLAITVGNGETALHYAAIAGNTKAAKILVEKDLTLTQLPNDYDNTPLYFAAIYGHPETVQYLLSVTPDDNLSPFEGPKGARLLNYIISAGFYDIALDMLNRYPAVALQEDSEGNTALLILANKPEAFPSGSNPRIYKRFQTTLAAAFNRRWEVIKHGDEENQGSSLTEFPEFGTLQHREARQLLRKLISEAVRQSHEEAKRLLGPSITAAARSGIPEFVTEVIKAYPSSIWFEDEDNKGIFDLAIIHRQEKVFNLLIQVSSYKHFHAQAVDKKGNNMLHLASKLSPSSKISGAALQMKRELQWFKEVEKIVPFSYRKKKNMYRKTPRELFTEEHMILVKQGEAWMKKTAESCALVAALVLTVVFAANFTAPGGNDQTTGFPIFLDRASFMTFAIGNALALFSSSTSLLMFLGILTSRYSEEDFLRRLPMKLSIGLITLFFSIVAMLTAYSASLHIVLSHKMSWIAVPIGLGACVPVTLFAILQFPLLVEIVRFRIWA